MSDTIKMSLSTIVAGIVSLAAFNAGAHTDPPIPVDPSAVIIDQAAAERLGRALFWDQQLGSGNGAMMACASCHYQAGTDSNPDRVAAGVQANGHLGSLGVKFASFSSLDCDGGNCQAIDKCSATGGWLRTGVQSPPVVESEYLHSFWDGRANRTFNGVDMTGQPVDGLFERDTDGIIIATNIAFGDSSQASQAIPPTNSSVEMACDGRTIAEVGYKMLRVVPLALQSGSVATDVQATTYGDLIAAAFDSRFIGDEPIDDVLPIRTGDPLNPAPQPTLTEQNFSMFFGLAIQAYEASLQYGGRAPTAEELVSMTNLDCDECHADGRSSAMPGANNPQNGFSNTGLELVFGSPGVTDPSLTAANVGRFKTPHLMNLALTGPYFHTGTAESLNDVLDFYVNGGCGGLSTDPAFCNGNAITEETEIRPPVDPLAEDIDNVLTMMREMLDPAVCEGSGPYEHPSLTLWLDDEDPDADLTMIDTDGGEGTTYIDADGNSIDCATLAAGVDAPIITTMLHRPSTEEWRVRGQVGDNDTGAQTVEAFLVEGGVVTLLGSSDVTTDGSWAVNTGQNSGVIGVDPAEAGVRVTTDTGGFLEIIGEIEFR